MTTEKRFEQLSPEQQDRARANFFNAAAGDGFWYLLNSDGQLISRNRRPQTEPA